MLPKIRKLTQTPLRPTWILAVVLSLLVAAADGRTDDPTSFKALFPVGIDHRFPRPEQTFREVMALILNHYYTDAISDDALYWAAIEGMLRHISPPETPELATVWTPGDYEKIADSLHGEQISIGVKSTFNPTTGTLTVTEVYPGSPADTVLLPFDRILRINNLPLKGKSLRVINGLLSGKPGQKIDLTVNRDVRVFEQTLVCEKFKLQQVIATRLSARMGMVEIKKFSTGTAGRIKQTLVQLAQDGIRYLIIDLRSNPGGVFLEALRTAELFLPKNHILMRAMTRDTGLKNYVSANPEPFVFDMAVLINGKTASSSEILASALQDHQKATLIGTRTFGKGIFEKTFALENRMRVKFITGAMLSPKGVAWHGKGIKPDFLVQQDDKTLATLMKMAPADRAVKDVAVITAAKLLERFDCGR